MYLFKIDFPHEWPGFFSDLSATTLVPAKDKPEGEPEEGALPSTDGVRLWLAVLNVIHQEVVSSDVNRNATDAAQSAILKDSMRDIAIPELVETWYNLLVAFHETHPDTVNATLEVMKPYVDWIEIGLVVNERFLPVLFKLGTMPEYTAKTMELFTSLIEKGMDRDPRAKLELMQTLQLPRILASISPADDETNEKVALAVNTMGVEVLDVYRNAGGAMAADPEMEKMAAELLQCALENLFKYYNDDVDDTSKSVAEFSRHYLQFARKVRNANGGLSPEMLEHLRILIQILHKKLRFDESYDFDDLSETEDEFMEFRRALGDQFRSITKMEPTIAFEYVENLITNLGAMTDPLDMEVALHCFYLVGEGYSDNSGTNPHAPFFIDAFRLLINSNIFNFEEPRALVSQFFECVTRYSRLFVLSPELIGPLLELWMGKHGVLHPHTPTRARRCSGFTQFVKNLKAPLQAYLMDIVEHLKDFASFRPDSFDQVSFDEQLELLESFGVLVGFDRSDSVKHKQFIDLLVMPLVENLSNLVEQKLYLNDTPHNQFHTKWMVCLIRGIGTFSKGFPLPIVTVNNARRFDTSAAPNETMIFFAKVFDVVMQILGVLGEKGTMLLRSQISSTLFTHCCCPLRFFMMTTGKYLKPIDVSNLTYSYCLSTNALDNAATFFEPLPTFDPQPSLLTTF